MIRRWLLKLLGGVDRADVSEIRDELRTAEVHRDEWERQANEWRNIARHHRRMRYGSAEAPGHRPIRGFRADGTPIHADGMRANA